MTRLAIIVGTFAILLGAGFLAGKNWDRVSELRQKIETFGEIRDATTDDRTVTDIDERLHGLGGK